MTFDFFFQITPLMFFDKSYTKSDVLIVFNGTVYYIKVCFKTWGFKKFRGERIDILCRYFYLLLNIDIIVIKLIVEDNSY